MKIQRYIEGGSKKLKKKRSMEKKNYFNVLNLKE